MYKNKDVDFFSGQEFPGLHVFLMGGRKKHFSFPPTEATILIFDYFLNTIWFQLHDILGKKENYEDVKDQWFAYIAVEQGSRITEKI